MLVVYAAATEWRTPATLEALASVPVTLLLGDLALSASLDLVKNCLIGSLSALSYCLIGYTKDIAIVALSTLLTRVSLDHTQLEAYACLVVGQAVWTANKLLARLQKS